MENEAKVIIGKWNAFVDDKFFPCVAAKTAAFRQQMKVMVAGHMGCPKDDAQILEFMYSFVDDYRANGNLFQSAVILFNQPTVISESLYDTFFWQRLQEIERRDRVRFDPDPRVDSNPESPNFSYSIKEEAFFIIGLHPASSRPSRRFSSPAIVFNPHAQFEQLRNSGQYSKMKNIIRKRDVNYSGSINPMLDDYGDASEVYQYTGQRLAKTWQCPLNNNYRDEHNQSA
jgi:hypothetical protein